MSKGLSISYGDVAPEAKENFLPVTSDINYDTLSNLQKYNLQQYNYASPCEMYQTLLDGTAVAFPSNAHTSTIGLWSEQLSGNDGKFTTPITLTMTSQWQYSSQGFTLTFDKFNDVYATSVTITWQRVTVDGTIILGSKTYTPDTSFYFCRNKVENFNKVIMTFNSINMPNTRLKLNVIDFGYRTIFRGDELRGVNISHSLNPISSEIVINTCDFTLDSHSDMEYSFQSKQPLSVSFNDRLIATTFVKSAKRSAKFLWSVSCEDYIGMMDNVPFVGGMYNGTKAGDLLEKIFSDANVPFSIDESFKNVSLYGYIPYTTCRAALMQVAFACQAVVNTSYSDKVKVYKLSDTVSQTIPLRRIMQGQSFTDDDTVTSVELVSHKYKPINEALDVYSADESGTGNNIIVKFSEPLHDLGILNGIIVESGTNYAIINAESGCELGGYKYEHTQKIHRKTNPKVLASETENVKSITNATLVSSNNVDTVLEKCYNWLTRTSSTNLKIIEGKNVVYGKPYKWGDAKWGEFIWGGTSPDIVTYDDTVSIGDKIKAETEYLGDVTGHITSEKFNLNGNILVKDVSVI